MSERPLPNPVSVNDSLVYELILEVRALHKTISELWKPVTLEVLEGEIELKEPAKKGKKKGE